MQQRDQVHRKRHRHTEGLVEDNEVNIELGTILLQQVGIRVLVARNGVEALQLLESRGVDGVLMDCQMPQMDGYEATRRIRANESGGRMPIIAMTANVMANDREGVLAVGIDDYLPKPIDVDQLYRKLIHWLGQARAEPAAVAVPDLRASSEVAALPSLPGIDMAEGLRHAFGDLRLYRRMLQLFRDHHDHFRRALAEAISERRSDTLLALVHALKGAAATVAAPSVAAAAEGLESTLRNGADPRSVDGAIAALEGALDQLRPCLDRV